MRVNKGFDLSEEHVTFKDGIYAISYKSNSERQAKRRGSSTESSYSDVDFETAITETVNGILYTRPIWDKTLSIGTGKFHYLLLLLAIPASCASVFETSSLSYVIPTATCDLQLTPYDRGVLNGAIYAGMITSACFWGFMSDRFGRQRVLVFGYLGDVVFTFVGACLAHDFWFLFTFRILSGVMICGPFSVFTSYLSEMFNSKRRDSIILMIGLFQSIGSIFQPLIAWVIIPQRIKYKLWGDELVLNSWRLFLMMCGIPSLMAAVGSAFCHESPRFLLSRGRQDEALRVFRSIYSYNTGRPADTYSVKSVRSEATETSGKHSCFLELTAIVRPPHLYKAVLAFSIQFGGLMTLNTIRLWMPQLLFYINQKKESSLSTCEMVTANHTTAIPTENCDDWKVDSSVYTHMLMVNLLTCTCFTISTLTVAFVGKRNLLLLLFGGQSLVSFGLGWARPPLTTALTATFVALATNSGIGLLSFVVHMFPTRLRTMAVSLTMMFGRIGVCLGTAALPFMLQISCHGTFVVVSAVALLCGCIVFMMAKLASKREPPRTPSSRNVKI